MRVIVFAAIFGIGMVVSERQSGASVFSALKHNQSVCILLFDWFNVIAPIGIIALIAPQVALMGPGIYTILADGDDTTNDPIVDTSRAILDGHVVLSRKQAEQGIFPAIDINASISRTMTDCVTPPHMMRARKFRRYLSLWEQNRDLMLLGGYQTGQDPELDMAFQIYPQLVAYIQQGMKDRSGLVESEAKLQALIP
jgi:flagellum-specific ATP synthase